MCGIIAVYHTEAASFPSADRLCSLLRTSLNSIEHRGPDASGVFTTPDACLGLGHVRLSIIDLETGNQPLSDEDDLIHCVVAGEIYEYAQIRAELEAKGSVFKTKSDSELVVQLYKHHGLNLLPSLRGEFAFVLYDSKRRLLFAARDRFGIKPLYYTVSDERILIGSEIKAFLPLGWKAQWDIDSIVHNGDFSDDRTVFKGVRMLMAGHFLLFRPTGYIKIQPYWDLSYRAMNVPHPSATVEQMIETVRKHIFRAIELRLRSDVPIGMYLSGGINSSAIAGMALKLLKEKDPNAKLATFTLAFPHAGSHDEGPIANRTSAFIGAETHMVHVTEADLVGVFERAVWHAEQPIFTFHAAGKLILSQFVHNKGYKVVLSGEGADEFFGGYAWFPLDYLRGPDPAGRALGLNLPSDAERQEILTQIQLAAVPQLSLSRNSYTDAVLGRQMLGGISTHRAYIAAGFAGAEVYTSAVLAVAGELDGTLAIADGIDARVRESAVHGEWHPLDVASYVTAKTILLQVILNNFGERVEMANSVEGRPPFLDHHLVEYINMLPPSVKVRPVQGDSPGVWSFTDKWILRQAVKPYITEEVFLRKKLSYNAPPMRRQEGDTNPVPLQAHLKARITRAKVQALGFFNWEHIEGLLKAYLETPEFPEHGGLDPTAQMLLYVLSFVVIQERFEVPTWIN
ncbi:putative asparagine synthase [Mycena rosella]|uniref:Asparagine synthase n=1 Tax=Mycena rosella TaxID=1033263 RepID=A0AAD7CLP4_MYCRO|nr:putative asparagine synthase [Mycena rosella]